MLSMTEIINGILIESSFYDGEISKSMKLSDELGIDSLRMVEIIVALEERFNITITETDMDPDLLKTVGDVYTLVDKYLK